MVDSVCSFTPCLSSTSPAVMGKVFLQMQRYKRGSRCHGQTDIETLSALVSVAKAANKARVWLWRGNDGGRGVQNCVQWCYKLINYNLCEAEAKDVQLLIFTQAQEEQPAAKAVKMEKFERASFENENRFFVLQNNRIYKEIKISLKEIIYT